MYEEQYISNLEDIYKYGCLEHNERTGIYTYRMPFTKIIVDLSTEFPILCSKKVNWKTAAKEILWIMQKQSNVTAELDSHIWDSWTGEDGTIGKSYGYQIGQPTRGYANQVEYVLETLKKDPSNRQCVISMWNVSELDEMNLVPCVYSSIWSIVGGRLYCTLVQRSADYPVGVPFDTTEYAILLLMFARHLGVKPGVLTHVMADSHIYANQVEGVKQQLLQYEDYRHGVTVANLNGVQTIKPSFVFKTDKTNFFDMALDDFDIENYNPEPAIRYEVAK